MRGRATEQLTPRRLRILATIVEAYVATGDPIGSKLLAEQLGVSSATVRNEMAALAEVGYLEQPHTSAGRIPSQSGYRIYVDSLMEESRLSPEEQLRLDRMLMLDAFDSEAVLENASRVLAGISRVVALSTTPSGNDAVIRGVQFVQTGRRTAMAILMLSSGTMKNRLFRCDFDLSQEMMRIFFRVLNAKLAGKPLSAITPGYIQTLASSLGELTVLLSSALCAILEMAQDALDADIRLNGQMNLLFYPEFDSVGVRQIMDFLESRQELSRLVFDDSNAIPRRAVQVRIGREMHRPELQDSSIILARYDVGGKPSGVIGVLGPTRMNYRTLVGQLQYLAEAVGRHLTELTGEDGSSNFV